MANADRYLDRSVHSRDLIDLAFLRLKYNLLNRAIAKAEAVYDVSDPLLEAISHFQNNPEYRSKCYQQLQIDNYVRAIDGLDLLAEDVSGSKTIRTFSETDFSYLE